MGTSINWDCSSAWLRCEAIQQGNFGLDGVFQLIYVLDLNYNTSLKFNYTK